MGEQDEKRPQQNLDELPEHERRPEGDTGGGMTGLGVSAEQHGPVNEEVIEAREEEQGYDPDEQAVDPDRPPSAYRAHSG